MLFKLVIPYYNRQVQGGKIARWHKAAGDWVEFGDDVLDLHIAEVRQLKDPGDLKKQIQMMTGPMAAQWMSSNRGQGVRMPQAAPADLYVTAPSAFDLRITASDSGRLCVVLYGEGTDCQVGDAVAILSTAEEELPSEVEYILKSASNFRVVPNPELCLCAEDQAHVNE